MCDVLTDIFKDYLELRLVPKAIVAGQKGDKLGIDWLVRFMDEEKLLLPGVDPLTAGWMLAFAMANEEGLDPTAQEVIDKILIEMSGPDRT